MRSKSETSRWPASSPVTSCSPKISPAAATSPAWSAIDPATTRSSLWSKALGKKLRPALRQQVGDGDRSGGSDQGRDGRGRPEDLDTSITPAVESVRRLFGVAMDLHRLVDEIDDPALRERCPGVEAGLVPVVDAIRAVCHFDDQHGTRRVLVQVRARVTGHDGDIGLGLRVVVERDGQL